MFLTKVFGDEQELDMVAISHWLQAEVSVQSLERGEICISKADEIPQ